jgi:hypothetical protein
VANPLRLHQNAQKSLVAYVDSCCKTIPKFQEFRTKMEIIDAAYTRYNMAPLTDGVDNYAYADTQCGATDQEISVPIVVSEVDSFVGYLADVYLSGYPMFPVVTTPALRAQAEKLEAIIDEDSILSGYARHFLMAFRDGIKYNLYGLEHDWAPIDQYSLATTLTTPTARPDIKPAGRYVNKLTRLDPYNLIWDQTVAPAFVPYCGEFAGYIEMVSRIEHKRRLLRYEREGGYNLVTAMTNPSVVNAIGTGMNWYNEPPQISDLLSSPSIRNAGTDWENWLNSKKDRKHRGDYSKLYEYATIYARIIPQEHDMKVPQDGTPQIWKLIVVNGRTLVYAKRIITAYDQLPLHIGQPLEDGFALQTKSPAENVIDYQDAASTLFSIRFNAARRAVVDRAVYDPMSINSSDINSPAPAAKIPLKQNALLGGKTIDSVYKQIPFDPRGTELAIQDVGTVWEFADRSIGLNRMQRGEFQKGNKNVFEVQRTLDSSDNRLRLPALTIEFQTMIPLKENIKLNILQHGQTGIYQSMKSGEPYELTSQDFQALISANLKFKIADGYTPKSKLASTDFLVNGMTLLGNSPILQQAWGAALPNMFAHLMQLGGVQGLDEYLPETKPTEEIPGAAPV